MIRSREIAFGNERSFLTVLDQDGFTDVFPNELIIKIFSLLHFREILGVATLNKKVSLLINDPGLLKCVIYRDMTFNPEDWTTYFGGGNPAADDEELAWILLPNNIGEIFKSHFLRKRKLGETHDIIWKPTNLSINNYVSLVEKNLNLKYCYIDVEKIGDKFTEKAEWFVITKKILPTSLDMSKHEDIIKDQKLTYFKSCNIPKVIESMICAVSIFLKFEVRTMWKEQNLTRCLESGDEDESGEVPFIVRMWGDALECCPMHVRTQGLTPVWKF